MTEEDVKIIFGNVAELAMFSDQFTERLENALGNLLAEGQREDHVGELFCDIVQCYAFLLYSHIHDLAADPLAGAAL